VVRTRVALHLNRKDTHYVEDSCYVFVVKKSVFDIFPSYTTIYIKITQLRVQI